MADTDSRSIDTLRDAYDRGNIHGHLDPFGDYDAYVHEHRDTDSDGHEYTYSHCHLYNVAHDHPRTNTTRHQQV